LVTAGLWSYMYTFYLAFFALGIKGLERLIAHLLVC